VEYAIYAAFSVYLFGILFMAMGVYRLWAGMVGAHGVNWAILPGTVVSEMAYIFGCLITGGEVRHAKLMGAKARSGKSGPDAEAEPTTEATPKLTHVGPVVAAFASILACGAGILIVHAGLGEPVIAEFSRGGGLMVTARLPEALPTTAAGFWDQLAGHLGLLRRMAGTLVNLPWVNWRVPLFIYLATCLTLRLAPIRRSLRATLAAVVVMAGIIALVGLVWRRFAGLMDDIWPLVTFLWSAMLLLLAVSLVVRGAVGLGHALMAKETPARRRAD